FKDPKRFDLVSYSPAGEGSDRSRQGSQGNGMLSFGDRPQHFGRVVGLPRDSVEVVGGRLRIEGQFWQEPYIAPEFRSVVSVPLVKLGPEQYLVLPEDRRLLETGEEELVISRDRILGRASLARWPLGWWWFRPNVFLKAAPE